MNVEKSGKIKIDSLLAPHDLFLGKYEENPLC